MLDRKKLIRVAVQTTAGTAGTVANADAVLCETLETNPLNTKTVDYNKTTLYMGGGEKIVVNSNSTFKASAVLNTGRINQAGATVVPEALPPYDKLLRASGMFSTYTNDIAGTSQASDGSLWAIKLADGSSSVDDFYAGQAISVISALDITVGGALTDKKTIQLADNASSNDSEYIDDFIEVIFAPEAIIASKIDAKTFLIDKTQVGSLNIKDMLLKAGTQTTIVTACVNDNDTAKWKITVNSNITLPITNGTTTVKVYEKRRITDYDGTTKIAALNLGLKQSTTAVTKYSIFSFSIIKSYNGTTKIATVLTKFNNTPDEKSYTLHKNLKYSLKSTGFENFTVHFHIDGVVHEYIDCKSKLSLSMKAGELGMFNFDATGLFSKYTDLTLPTITFSNNVKPLPIVTKHAECYFLGQKIVMSDFSLEQGTDIVHSDKVGYEGIHIKDYQPSGSVTFRATNPSVFNFLKSVTEQDTGFFIITLGDIGNMFAFFAQEVSCYDPTYTEQDGETYFTFKLNFNAVQGNDNYTFIYQ